MQPRQSYCYDKKAVSGIINCAISGLKECICKLKKLIYRNDLSSNRQNDIWLNKTENEKSLKYSKGYIYLLR